MTPDPSRAHDDARLRATIRDLGVLLGEALVRHEGQELLDLVEEARLLVRKDQAAAALLWLWQEQWCHNADIRQRSVGRGAAAATGAGQASGACPSQLKIASTREDWPAGHLMVPQVGQGGAAGCT